MTYKTEQEAFWAGSFGDDYSQRNDGAQLLQSKIAQFSTILKSTGSIESVIEFGANIGLNLQSLERLLPNIALSALEINEFAVSKLTEWGKCQEVFHQSALTFESKKQYEMSMILGVLVHTNPSQLPAMYEKLYQSSKRWILVSEAYNPKPIEIEYRGNAGRYYKRDFAGEMLELYPDLKLVDYGFIYRRDTKFPQDDATWFLMEKRGEK